MSSNRRGETLTSSYYNFYEAGLRWREACGVFGIYAPGQDVARTTFFGLFALQHRGQESAGIAVGDGQNINRHVGLGLAFQVFDESIIQRLKGIVALGHVRYSTTGGNVIANAQPMVGHHRSGPFAIAHNGNLINAAPLRLELEQEGVEFAGSSDTEVMCKLLEQSLAPTIEEAIVELMNT
ncbi:MAG: class II glutamine amidotransferase, partial [Armatimonadetes bacterium]|nr:class II glutamine amidotransferase [Armatimonadota bacterium]